MEKESNISKFWNFGTKLSAIISIGIGFLIAFYSTNSINEKGDYTNLRGIVIDEENNIQIGAIITVGDVVSKTDEKGEFFLEGINVKRYTKPFDKQFFLRDELINMIEMDRLEDKKIADLKITLGNESVKDSLVYDPLTTYGSKGNYKGGEVQVFEVKSNNH